LTKVRSTDGGKLDEGELAQKELNDEELGKGRAGTETRLMQKKFCLTLA